MIDWRWQDFDQLSGREVHDVIALREAVFAVEQDCAYQDVDGLDPSAWHLRGFAAGELVAYLRGFGPGVHAPEVVIGRVVVRLDHRGTGLGRTLMARGLEVAHGTFGPHPVRVSAQAHLAAFYGSLGFETVGPGYLEDGIPHVPMVRPVR